MASAYPPGPPGEQFTHTGQRFVLGFGPTFYGIWDRLAPGPPIRQYARTPDGWAQAWHEYSAWEPNAAPVAGAQPQAYAAPPAYAAAPAYGAAPAYAPPGYAPPPGYGPPTVPVSGAWWILPIFFGLLGGLIAWASVKPRDPRRARSMLITGLVISVIYAAIVVSSGS